jgi:antitoxin (DNA-binding transcriptional repressor) of toxin-antitoxin stability system
MRKRTISVTEAARNFAECVNRVHYQEVTFVLLKNGIPVARLGPDLEKVCLGRDLAKLLSQTGLSSGDAAAWRSDLLSARKALKLPFDKWQ